MDQSNHAKHDEIRDADFTDTQFEEAWNIYMAQNSDKHIMMSAMRSAAKIRKSRTEYTVTVELPQLKGALENPEFKLTQFLRNHLKNDNLQLEITVQENENRAKRLPPQEFLKKIMTLNPEMAKFLKSIDAELS